jgi:hypothetical protein
LSLKTRLVASRLRTHPLNARDLSEPTNGTTSGCPPPSQHHNYRRYLHTQQRNRSERCEPGRFWKAVAQITRIRDRTFIASLCSLTLFPLGPFCVRYRCANSRCAGFPSRASIRTESSDRSEHPTAKNGPRGDPPSELSLRPSYRCSQPLLRCPIETGEGFAGYRRP